jgi:hypothetical protein
MSAAPFIESKQSIAIGQLRDLMKEAEYAIYHLQEGIDPGQAVENQAARAIRAIAEFAAAKELAAHLRNCQLLGEEISV